MLNYLTKEEYLNLPRKMSRIGEGQRTIIYNLFVRYEQLKKVRELCISDDFITQSESFMVDFFSKCKGGKLL